MATAKVKLGDRPAPPRGPVTAHGPSPPRGPVTAHGPSPKNNFFATVRSGLKFDFKLEKAKMPWCLERLTARPNGAVWFLVWILSFAADFRKHFHPSEGADMGGAANPYRSHWMPESHPSICLRNVEEC
jgi:hypothetical protein